MLQIILFVLKILGWILLAVLGLLVLVLLLVLFTPLRYQAEVRCKGKLSTLEAGVRFHILFHLASGTISYQEKKLLWNIRAAWIKLGNNEETADVGEKAEETAEKVLDIAGEEVEKITEKVSDIAGEEVEETTEKVLDIIDEKAEETVDETSHIMEKGFEEIRLEELTEEVPEMEERAKAVVTEPQQKIESHQEEDNSDGVSRSSAHEKTASANKEETVERKQKKEKVGDKNSEQDSLFDKIASAFEKIKYTFSRICDKIKALLKKVEDIMAFLENSTHQSAFWKLLAELKKLLYRMRPKQVDGKLQFGFDDPSLTGRVLAGFSMLYPYWEVQLYPDFENKILDGEVSVKGSARLWPAAVLAWNMVWNRDVRRTIMDVKKMISKKH